jgi:hypothetical protein
MVGVRPTVTRPLTTAEQVAAKAAARAPALAPLVRSKSPSPGTGAPVVPPGRNVLPDIPLRRPPMRDPRPQRPGGPIGPLDPGHGLPLVIPDGWPLHLTAQMLLQPGASGQSPALQTLRAPVGRWLVIEEIKFEVKMAGADNPDVATAVTNANGMGSVIAVGLSRGQDQITKGYVPMSMFGPSAKPSAERILYLEDAGVLAYSFYEEYSWRLPVPIILAPGDVLVPTFEHRGLFNYKARARISYSGKLYRNKPDGYGVLPYVASWAAQPLQLDGTEREVLSTEKDLVNPSSEATMRAHYMLGRIYFPWQGASNVTMTEGVAENPATWFNAPLAADQTKVKISTSWANPVIPEYVPYPAAFDLVNRKLDMEHIIPPEAYFAVGVKSGGVAINNAQAIAIFSLIGQREVTP